MKIRSIIAAAAMAMGLGLVSHDSTAKELRDPRAHLLVDVPDSWKVGIEGNYAVAYPADETFHLRLVATDRGHQQEDAAERWLMTFLANHLDHVTVDDHAKRIDHNNYVGVEIFGRGKEHNGAPAKWFALHLVDKQRPSKGVVVLGTGTLEGYDRHWRGIREALKTLRTY